MFECNNIVLKYRYQIQSLDKPLKKAILECQKELIENGLVGNASW
jgi:hypothetical protein